MHVPSVPHYAQGRASMRMHKGRASMRMLALVVCNKGTTSPCRLRSDDSRGNTHGQRSMPPTPGIKPVKCSRGGPGDSGAWTRPSLPHENKRFIQLVTLDAIHARPHRACVQVGTRPFVYRNNACLITLSMHQGAHRHACADAPLCILGQI